MKTPLELRNEKGASREEVAGAVKLSPIGYVNIELGNKEPSFKAAKRIAQYFDVPVDSIVFGKEIKKISLSQKLNPTGTEGS